MFAEAILWFEFLRHARRKSTYVWRTVYLVFILLALLVCWPTGQVDFSNLEEMGRVVDVVLLMQFFCSGLLCGFMGSGMILGCPGPSPLSRSVGFTIVSGLVFLHDQRREEREISRIRQRFDDDIEFSLEPKSE